MSRGLIKKNTLVPVSAENIQKKIGYAKKARVIEESLKQIYENTTQNKINENNLKKQKEKADELEKQIDDYLKSLYEASKDSGRFYKYIDWKYGNLQPTYTLADGGYNTDWYLEQYNKKTGTKRIGW